MFSLLSHLLGFRRSIGLGVFVAVLVVFLSHYVPALSPRAAIRNDNMQMTSDSDNGRQHVVAMPQKSVEAEATEESESKNRISKEEIFKSLEMDEQGFNWRKDWWKYLCIVIVGLLVVMCGIRLTKMLFRLVIFLICMVTGFLGACWIGPYLTPVLQPHIPEKVLSIINPELIGYVAGFVIAYLVITIVMALLPKTVRGGGTKDK